jgi:tetratricopeptide (TPR) repeat protein
MLDGARQLLRRCRTAGEHAYVRADYDLALACWLLGSVLGNARKPNEALPLVDEARRRFEAVANAQASEVAERMASVCFEEQGKCLLHTGRLDEAAAAYEERIRRGEQLGDDRGIAVGKGGLGTVRLLQHRYSEALAAYQEALDWYTRLKEPGKVALYWHQTGIAHQGAEQPEAAEDAYRQSLAISVRLGDVAAQACRLAQLGALYLEALNRSEEAVSFFHQAADRFVEIGDVANEGITRNNLAEALRKLRRLDEARQELRRAIECKEALGHAGSVWDTWAVLADIEIDAGNPAAAEEARAKAIAGYLAYRRDGGENQDTAGRISLAVTQSLLAGDAAAAASLLQELAANPDFAWLRSFIQALQAIVAGSRDCALADAPELDYSMAAEILFLIETLEKPR